MSAYYLLSKAKDGQFFWNLKAPYNHEAILTSEMYITREGANNGIASCRVNSGNPYRYTRLTSSRGLPYFVLKGANGLVIGVSEEYSSNQARDNGIAACMTHGPVAQTVDHSRQAA